MYMFRAYQSPASGTHCGVQWHQMPNLASRYHSGASYCISESHVGLYGPSPLKPGMEKSLARRPTNRLELASQVACPSRWLAKFFPPVSFHYAAIFEGVVILLVCRYCAELCVILRQVIETFRERRLATVPGLPRRRHGIARRRGYNELTKLSSTHPRPLFRSNRWRSRVRPFGPRQEYSEPREWMSKVT